MSRPGIGAAVLLLLALAGCGGGEPETTTTPAGFYTLPPDQCLARLDAQDIEWRRWSAPTGREGCRVAAPIEVQSLGVPLDPALKTSCEMARAWLEFVPAIQKAARAELGSTIAEIEQAGSYGCRKMTGNKRRMSLHANARALDIHAFTTADGRRIRVVRDWNKRGQEGAFLRAFTQAACRHFGVVLTPRSDGFHLDHIHLDIGPWKLCEG